MSEKNGNSGGSGAAAGLLFVIAAALFICLLTQPMGLGTPADMAQIWDYGHGEGTSVDVSLEKLKAFYQKVDAVAPNKRGRLQKYRKKIMRFEEGYEYASDKEWDAMYKKIIARQTKEWKARH